MTIELPAPSLLRNSGAWRVGSAPHGASQAWSSRNGAAVERLRAQNSFEVNKGGCFYKKGFEDVISNEAEHAVFNRHVEDLTRNLLI